MSARAGVGVSENTDSLEAGREAARLAWQQFGTGQPASTDAVTGAVAPPVFAFVFATSRLDAPVLTRGIRDVLGPELPLFGAHANGVISNEYIGYDGFQVAVALVGGDNIQTDFIAHQGIAFAEHNAGAAIGRMVRDSALAQIGPYSLVFLYDSVNRTKGRLVLNLATPLIDGMKEHLDTWPPTVGARVLGDMKFSPTYQWAGTELYRDAAVGLILGGTVHLDTAIMHGCRPTSAYHTVTRSEGPQVLELDGRPALSVVGEILGPDLCDDYEKYKFFVTLGINYGEKWAPYQEEHYANRMCVGVVPDKQSLVFTEPIAPGTEVQLMRRNFELDYNRHKANSLIEQVLQSGRTPFLALYINCAGRAASYYGSDEEEAAYVQAAIDNRFPLIGAYEAGEIAAVNGQMQILDWTGVLTILSFEETKAE